MRILMASAPPWANTGYGSQSASLARRLQKDGHQVAFLPMAEYGGGYSTLTIREAGIEGMEFLPHADSQDRCANDAILPHVKGWQPDVVITLCDPWPMTGYGGPEMKWVSWTPVDGDPMGPANAEALERAWKVVSMSRHGERTMSEAGIHNTYVPHGIEKHFEQNKEAGKAFREEMLKVPADAFVMGTVGMNYAFPGRKGFDRLIEGFARFAKDKENVYLYIHASPLPNSSHDLSKLAKFHGVEDRVIFPQPYSMLLGYTPMAMVGLYNALDVYVQTTHGEGFGIPVLEALACGVPVIATDCTSMPELVGIGGWLVPPVARYMNLGYYYHYLIDIDGLVEGMEEAYEQHDVTLQDGITKKIRTCRLPTLRQICRMQAQNYLWDGLNGTGGGVYDTFWRPFLTKCEREIEGRADVDSRSGATIVLEEDRVRKIDGPQANVKREFEVLSKLDHPNIVKPVASGEHEGRFYFEMPRYRYTLADESPDPRILPRIREAIDYLHSHGIAHRDLHPSNVVYNDPDHPVLIDFAWAEETDPRVDLEPWNVPEKCVPSVRKGIDQRGYHTIVAHVRGLSLDDAKATALSGVPYQQIDGAGERDCELRWEIMSPDVKGKVVVDFGCNLGWFVNKALEEGAVHACGIDKDAVTVGEAAKLYPEGEFRVSDLEKAVDYEADVGFCLSVLQHLKNPERVLEVMRESCEELYVEIPEGVVDLGESEYLGESERGRKIVRFRRPRRSRRNAERSASTA